MVAKKEKYMFMRILRNFHSDTVNDSLVKTRNIVERKTVQWVDGLDKIGINGVGSKNPGAKLGGDESVAKRGGP